MCACIQWFAHFTDSQLFAAIIGALIGIFPAHWISTWNERRRDQQTYKSWLNGLLAELRHVDACIKEITQIVQAGNPSTKRLNSDFVAQSRLALFAHDKDTDFLQCLTNAYRDIVHTNDMLTRLENRAPNHNSIQGNVLASLTGVGVSVTSLTSKVEVRLKPR